MLITKGTAIRKSLQNVLVINLHLKKIHSPYFLLLSSPNKDSSAALTYLLETKINVNDQSQKSYTILIILNELK